MAIEIIFLDQAVANDMRAQSIVAGLPDTPVELVDGPDQVIRTAQALKDPIGDGKRMLFLTRHKGEMVAKCPGTHGHICCGYQILDLMSNCPMDCSYCILQGYLNNPVMTVFTNLSDVTDDLLKAASEAPWRYFRVGPGELADSLALDHVIRYSDDLVEWFADHETMILELKTKSVRIEHLLDLRHGGQTVVSWSLNPQSIIDAEEHGAPGLAERLRAARTCQEAGYPIGLHFDPMIPDDSWEKEYKAMVEEIFRYVNPRGIIWISMGGLRFPPSMKSIIQDRFPKSRILLGELFPGRDGKFRYLETIRVDMFKKMRTWLREIDPGLFVYLCMESHEVWKVVYGWSPGSTAGLIRAFDQHCRAFMKRRHQEGRPGFF
jgi:spore photoproduct lyase